MKQALFFLSPAIVSFLAIPFLMRVAVKFRILDIPGRRKIHKKATPLLGGLAIYFGLLAGLLVQPGVWAKVFIPFLAASAILLLGLIDDIRGLGARIRLACQFIITSLIISSGTRINFLAPGFFGDFAEIILTFIWIIGLTNAYNYLDGMDGLAAGSAVLNFFCFFLILNTTSQLQLASFALICLGAILGFIPYNIKQAKMFLGDAGSTFLGFLLAVTALTGNWAENNVVKISIPILILGVPIFDMIFTSVMRIKEGKVRTFLAWLEYGGRDHFHHYLVDIGLLPFGAVIFIYFITLSLGISAIMVANGRALDAWLTLSQASIMFGVIATLIVAGKRRRSG